MTTQSWQTPHSSNIAEIHYDSETREMTVTFKSGGSYVVSGVSPTDASDLANHTSPGSHYNQHFRGRYQTRKL